MNNSLIFERHFSEKLNISLEIPQTWQKIANHHLDEHTEGYFYPAQSAHNPQIFIKKIVIPETEQHEQNFIELADELLQLPLQKLQPEQFEIISQTPTKIDNYSARLDIFVFQPPDVELPITQYQVCWQCHHLVYGLVAMVESTAELEYLPIFATVAGSINCHPDVSSK
ncbi:hypothetical protein H6G80_22640 [Nostoc sp. FACHB-87]|uniref:hypothetical protein n=1 Tax=Nostocaceae TaxID=1162 RepID=UPI001682B9FE|nr:MULTISPECIES: hypothetical protein [Nostocaceae]MBD2456861.1 hypothetical protein [Nostoc sp. FACHB-87]MBD2478129.1 hypothetical protein [Anabaena sp. FACHB-83]